MPTKLIVVLIGLAGVALGAAHAFPGGDFHLGLDMGMATFRGVGPALAGVLLLAIAAVM